MKPADIPLDRLFRRLHLANAPRIYRALAEKAEQEQWSYRDFLAVLVAKECERDAALPELLDPAPSLFPAPSRQPPGRVGARA